MASLNRVILVGNLTKDPELKFIPSGQAVCNLRMAMNRKWKSQNGEWKDEVTYVGVVVWGKSAEACGEYLKKGSPLLVEGRLQSRSWDDKETGQKRSILEIVSERVQFLSGGGARREGGQSGGSAGGGGGDFEGAPMPEPPAQSEDDIPF